MNQFDNHPEFYDQPIRLNDEQKAEPLSVLQAFFQNCHLHEVRKMLWKMLECSLTIRYSVYDEAADRSQLLWFYREMETMAEAAFVVCQKSNPVTGAITPVTSDPSLTPKWKTKSMLEDEIRSLRIKNAELERDMIELRKKG